jgi:hypothetical protein
MTRGDTICRARAWQTERQARLVRDFKDRSRSTFVRQLPRLTTNLRLSPSRRPTSPTTLLTEAAHSCSSVSQLTSLIDGTLHRLCRRRSA